MDSEHDHDFGAVEDWRRSSTDKSLRLANLAVLATALIVVALLLLVLR